MSHMILVKTAQSREKHGEFKSEMYSRVNLHIKGGRTALLLASEDRITEAICFVLSKIVNVDKKAEADGKENPATPPSSPAMDSSKESPLKSKGKDDNKSSSKSKSSKENGGMESPAKHPTRNYRKELKKILEEEFDNGRKLLQCAAYQQNYNTHHFRQIVKFLSDHILKDQDELLFCGDIYGRTVLHFAALRGNVEFCKFLINECNMRVDETDINKEDLLHYAVRAKNEAVVEYLCGLDQVKSIIGSADAQGRTTLHKAAAQGVYNIIECLLKRITNSPDQGELVRPGEGTAELIFIRQPDKFGQTALLEAARGGNLEAVKLLLKMGSRPLCERNSDGRTALHYAAQLPIEKNPKEIAKLLLNECGSVEEKSLFLWVSAIGIGTAEESAKTSKVKIFLRKRRFDLARNSREDLLTSAIEKEDEKIAWELVNRGAAITQIHKQRMKNYEF